MGNLVSSRPSYVKQCDRFYPLLPDRRCVVGNFAPRLTTLFALNLKTVFAGLKVAGVPVSIFDWTQNKCPKLAEFFEGCCNAPLTFEGDQPIRRSSHNHIHLWALEWWTDHHPWIDLEYRVEFIEKIFRHWRGRLKGIALYQNRGNGFISVRTRYRRYRLLLGPT